ncbi:MAG: hypothetical protein PUE12_04295 [Oscillospiraceae bacterium]|nr:hypothetical protein [Oscillospiraceae bacterium]
MKSYLVENNSKNFSTDSADVDGDGIVSGDDADELSMYLTNQLPVFSCVLNTDTDNDGICDYIEKEVLKSNSKKPDTDDDGLTDYEEVYLCNTDPLIKDTVTKEMLDIDGDGLLNTEEILAGTNPLNKDSDSDGINDFDEINKYSTKPNCSDTDEDGISDLGEIKLGTDPLKASESEIFEQSLLSDSQVLNSVNSENSKYNISLNVKAGGYINEAINVSKSVYSEFLSEEEILGEIVDIKYDTRFSLNELNITFELKNISNPKNYMIFKYSPEATMLLPVETSYSGNKLTVNDTSDGTFCVANIAEIKENYEIISELETDTYEIESYSTAENVVFASELTHAAISKISLDCQFYLDDSTCSVVSWNEISSSLISAVKKLEKDHSCNIRLEFFAYGYAVNISCTNSSRLSEICSTADAFFSDSSINSMLSAYNYYTKMKAEKTSDVWNELSTYYPSGASVRSSKDVVLVFNPHSYDMSVCGFQVGNSFCRAYNRNISAYGKSFRNALSSADSASDKIYTIATYTEKVSSMHSVRASLFGKLLLLAPLSPNSKTDSDNDGNPDSKEFDFGKEIKLEKVTAKSNAYSSGATQFKSETGIDINSETVVPMLSDPTKEDSDGDGIVDAKDAKPREKFDDRFNLSDSNYINVINSNIYDKQKYGDSIYNTRTEEDDGVPQYALDNMKIRAYGNDLAFLLFPNASKFIAHFLGNTGNSLWYDASPIVNKTDIGKLHYTENMNIVRELCEATVLDELCFMSAYNTRFTGASFSSAGGYTRRPVDWWFSIGDADATMSIRCKKNGNSYTAEVEYNILDFYNWNEGSTDFGGLVVDGEMFLLHVHGMAREMQTIGTYKTTMTWVSGERLTIK